MTFECTRRFAQGLALFLLLASAAAGEVDPLIGTWRVISYPTGDGDLLRRHGHPAGTLPPPADAPLKGWSFLIFASDGRCALMYPQRDGHRRSAWQHDEDNFALWTVDRSREPWHLDMSSVACPKIISHKETDAATGKTRRWSEPVIDPATGKAMLRRWAYPGIVRIDGDLLTIMWYQNHGLKESLPESDRTSDFCGLPNAALVQPSPPRDQPPFSKIRGGISGLIARRFSAEALDIPLEPAADEVPLPAKPAAASGKP